MQNIYNGRSEKLIISTKHFYVDCEQMLCIFGNKLADVNKKLYEICVVIIYGNTNSKNRCMLKTTRSNDTSLRNPNALSRVYISQTEGTPFPPSEHTSFSLHNEKYFLIFLMSDIFVWSGEKNVRWVCEIHSNATAIIRIAFRQSVNSWYPKKVNIELEYISNIQCLRFEPARRRMWKNNFSTLSSTKVYWIDFTDGMCI